MAMKNSNILLDSRWISTMRCLLVLSALVAMASAIGEGGFYDPGRYDPGRYDAGRYDPGRYDPSKYDQSGRWTPDKSGQYNGDRGGSGGQYDGGYGDNGDRGGAGGFYVPEPQPIYVSLPPVPVTTTTTPKPRDHPINNYQYKYAIGDDEKILLQTLNLDGESDDLNKAFFEYSDAKNKVYRTDYVADYAPPHHVL